MNSLHKYFYKDKNFTKTCFQNQDHKPILICQIRFLVSVCSKYEEAVYQMSFQSVQQFLIFRDQTESSYYYCSY